MEVGWRLLDVSTAFHEGSCRACWWGCGSRAEAVEEAGYRVRTYWVLYRKYPTSPFAPSTEAAELPCRVLQGPGLVSSSVSRGSMML